MNIVLIKFLSVMCNFSLLYIRVYSSVAEAYSSVADSGGHSLAAAVDVEGIS